MRSIKHRVVQSTKSYQKNFLFFMHNLGIIIKKERSKNYVIRKSKEISREFDTLKFKKAPQSLEIGLFFCQFFVFIRALSCSLWYNKRKAFLGEFLCTYLLPEIKLIKMLIRNYICLFDYLFISS